MFGAHSKEILGEFNSAALHDLLSLFDVAFFAVFDNFPELIGEDISSLVELVLGFVILSEIGVLIREIVEVFNKVL